MGTRFSLFEGEAKKSWIRFVQRAEWTHFTTPPNCFRPVCATPMGFSSSTGTKNLGGTGATFFVLESKSHSDRGGFRRGMTAGAPKELMS